MDDDDDEETDSISPFDKIDELLYFMEQLNNCMQREPQAYQQVISTLPQELQHRLSQFEEEAQKRIIKKEEAGGGN